MLWPRHSTTTRNSGFTIIELAISSSLFLLMSIALFSLFGQTRKATDFAIESTDTSSKMLLLFEKIRNEIKGVRILGTTTDDKLEYWKVLTVDGIPQLTPIGRPDYIPGTPVIPDSAFLYLGGGRLMSDFQGSSRILTRVGKDSVLAFDWNAATHTLGVTGRIESDTGRTRGENFAYRMYVSNNE